jgi:2-hydroxychromene-2-carboxylate isomerase
VAAIEGWKARLRPSPVDQTQLLIERLPMAVQQRTLGRAVVEQSVCERSLWVEERDMDLQDSRIDTNRGTEMNLTSKYVGRSEIKNKYKKARNQKLSDGVFLARREALKRGDCSLNLSRGRWKS